MFCRQEHVSYRLILHMVKYYSVIMHEELRAGWLVSLVVRTTDSLNVQPIVT